ncbi:RB1-inducible coiled-coil protein 1, putative isoform 1 [Cucumis melo var. makuwa]|uniref:RB1-inducible coiled-coil protein 1, putative isoform 1 n=1 Tax=Cucumis melo var. makuwa TaxID=1194695 RepID=A0A5D3CJM8_CUCMM|nr:RB1-inducible coiled-coil protein 1, putative isoform 1 [Cucumis melo var. makuwa]
MGMDMLPLDAKDVVELSDKRHNSKGVKTSNKESNGRGLHFLASSKSNHSKQMDLHSSYHDNDKDADRDDWSSDQKMGKSHRREHPQEEELQKFKKEFEAWQAARFRECSRVIEVSSINRRSLKQEDLAKEKITINANTRRTSSQKVSAEPKGSTVEMKSYRSIGLDDCVKRETFPAEQRGTFSLRSKSMDADFEHPCLISYDQKDKSHGPTKIVILKPGPDKMCVHEEHWKNSSGNLGERVSIEDFLDEVKERLRCELQGKTFKKGYTVRGSGIETPYSERPSHRRQIAQNIATQVRDSVTRDIGINLLRSESTRSYNSEVQFIGLDSPEFVNKDTRRLLSERLRNVRSKDPDLDSGSSRSSVCDHERVMNQVETTLTNGKHTDYWEVLRDAEEIQTRSFRHEANQNEVLPKELSPRNLTRSLSAPVSGTSFGKLLLEDRHILTGVHIQRKHEAGDHVAMSSKKQKKERFNFKEKVSNFRYNFTLRGKLFGRKTQSISGLHSANLYSSKDILSGPTVVMNSGERHERENFTEVPPSPASVCSSVQEEFWKLSDHQSPISTSDVTPREEKCVSQVFREISSNLKELRRQLNQLDSDDIEDKVEQQPVESEITKLEDPAEAYIRDLLIVSGMYDGSTDNNFTRNNAATKPISDAIFEEVEEAYRKSETKNEIIGKEQSENSVDHKMLFDLLNEALPIVLAPCLTLSKFKRKVINSSMPPRPLFGKKLLDPVWDVIRKFIHPSTDRSYYLLDGVMARDLNSTPWSSLVDDEVNTTGREVEALIMKDLVEEIVKDLLK